MAICLFMIVLATAGIGCGPHEEVKLPPTKAPAIPGGGDWSEGGYVNTEIGFSMPVPEVWEILTKAEEDTKLRAFEEVFPSVLLSSGLAGVYITVHVTQQSPPPTVEGVAETHGLALKSQVYRDYVAYPLERRTVDGMPAVEVMYKFTGDTLIKYTAKYIYQVRENRVWRLGFIAEDYWWKSYLDCFEYIIYNIKFLK